MSNLMRRNASGEMDVFEAGRCFRGSNENSSFSQKTLREERNMAARNILLPQQSCSMGTQMKEKIKYKQPSSPGGRLANFLTSLFNQSSLKKKKKKKMQSSSSKEEGESSGGTKKRRSSISNFRSYITMDSKSIYSTSSSGYRTPPPYVQTPIMSLKEFTTQKHKSPAPANDGSEKESLRNGYSERDRIWADKHPSEKELGKMEVEEESDSSSDLFELQIYDFYPSDLPVYESTSMEKIKRGPQISNAHL